MALTLEQEQALLALLDEQKLTLSELESASELNGSDLMLVRQGILDKSLKGETLKRYVTPPAASLTTSGLTKLSNAVSSNAEDIAATSKAVKSAYDLAGKALMKESNLADLTNVADALINLGLGEAAKREVGSEANQIPDMSGFTRNFASNGWQKLPGGLIFQWISTIATSPTNGTDTTIWWPTAFPNACLMVQATFSEGSSPFTDITVPIFITGRSRLNVTVRSYTGLANTIDIFAIGY